MTQTKKSSPWLGQAVALGVGLTVALFLLPTLFHLSPLVAVEGAEALPPAEIFTPPTPALSVETMVEPPSVAEPLVPTDGQTTVLLQRSDGSVDTLSLGDYLFGVVAAEMPASFQPEALKAQAVAARTYTITKQATSRHENGALCDDSTCCQAYVDCETLKAQWGESYDFYRDKIQSAVADTDGLEVLYEGEPIEALFFAAAAGRTVDAVDVWGSNVSYLVGVNSPEGEGQVPDYHSQVRLTKSEVQSLILATYPGANLSGAHTGWLTAPTYTTSASVQTLQVGGLTLSGGEVRKLFSLRSATFSCHWEGNTLIFDVTGHGHGVGMSQYGANAMAEEGKTFQEILAWYYTGTTVE